MEISGSAAPTAGQGQTAQSARADARARYSRSAGGAGEVGANAAARSVGKSIAGYESVPRARRWSEDVEDLYRLQYAGWRDEEEYKEAYGPVTRLGVARDGAVGLVTRHAEAP